MTRKSASCQPRAGRFEIRRVARPEVKSPAGAPHGRHRGVSVRRLAQIASLGLFGWLFLATTFSGAEQLGPHLGWFLRFDPLLLAADILARGIPHPVLLWALSLVAATLLLGRFFCGWICPMGTVLDGCARLLPGRRHEGARHGLRNLKYYLLIALLLPVPFSGHLAGLLDPLCLLTRSMAIVIHPASILLGEKLGDFYATPVAPVTEPVYQFLRTHYLPVGDYSWTWPLLFPTLLLFLLVLGLEVAGRRFWCRYLCPLGGLLSAISVFAWLRRRPARNCRDCGACASLCKAGGFDEAGRLRTSECMMCLTCVEACPDDRISFVFRRPTPARSAPDLTRRSVVVSLAAGALAGPGIAIAGLDRPHARLLRPPGGQDEGTFLHRCARCGACTRVCPTQGLVPIFLEAGPGGLWTPKLDPGSGYCELGCTLCGQVCPTGAIPRLSQHDKAHTRIGLAIFHRKVCLPFAKHQNCLVCEEVCPTSQKAIVFDARRVETKDGPRDILFPRVQRDLCIGCGICEYKCPLEGEKGIINYRTEAVPPELPAPPGEPLDADVIRATTSGPYGGYDGYGEPGESE